MSYRKLLFASRGVSRELNHRFRKFQRSKRSKVVITKPKTKLVEVPIND